MIREDKDQYRDKLECGDHCQNLAGGTLFEMDAMTILPIMIMIQVTDTITVARLVDIKPVLFK